MDLIVGAIVLLAVVAVAFLVWRKRKPEVAARYDSPAEIEAAVRAQLARLQPAPVAPPVVQAATPAPAPAAPPQQPAAPPSAVAAQVIPPAQPAVAVGAIRPAPMPVGAIPLAAGGFYYQGTNFANFEEFAKWAAAVAQRDANLAQWVTEQDTPGKGFPVWDAAKVAATLANFDASMAAGREDLAFYQLSQDESYALQNRGWKRVDVNRKINQYNSGPAPQG